ncbi:MAG: cation transporter [Methylococcales bacterium]|nr:cation transporter [Methylococcales bacterium]
MGKIYDANEVIQLKTRVTYVGALVNVFLTALKIGFGLLGQSASLVADGIHSLSDLISDFFVIVAIKMGSREADHNHPYGHRRFETIATVMLGLGLVGVATGIAWDASERLLSPESLLIPTQETLGIAVISIIANEGLFHYTKSVGKKTRSKLLLANAWHHRSDAFSSIVVLLGIGAVLLGYEYADMIAAIIVALMIAKMGLSLAFESVKELVDSSLPEGFVSEITKTIKQTEGIESIHFLRTRQMGEDAYVDAHIVVGKRITVSEAHMIGDAVKENIKEKFDDVVDVLVHADPEDDEFHHDKDKGLLTRKQIQTHLDHYFADHLHSVEDFRIHYLEGLIEIEIILPYGLFIQPTQIEWIKKRCKLFESELDMVSKVYVFFKI